MKTFPCTFIFIMSLLTISARAVDQPRPESLPKGQHLFVIERQIPGAANLTSDELKSIAIKSCTVLRELGPQIRWVQSYVTDDKIYCVYVAPDEEAVREHAIRGGFPANSINRVATIISPQTAE